MNAFFAQHRDALHSALRRLLATPLGSVLSLMVIGVALALPAAGWVVLDNLRSVAGNVSGTQQLSVFMALEANARDVAEIEYQRLGSRSRSSRTIVPLPTPEGPARTSRIDKP